MRAFMTARPGSGLAYLIASGLLWGTGGLTGSLLGRVAGLTALSVAACRLTAGGLLIVVFLAVTGRNWPAGRAAWTRIAVIGVLAALYQSCYFTAVALTSVALATLVTIGTAPVIVLGAYRVTGRRAGRLAPVAACLALVGLGLLVGLPSGFSETAVLASAGMAVLAAAAFAAVTLTGARPVPGLDELTVTGFAFTVGGMILMPLAAALGGLTFRPGPEAIGLLVALGTGPTAVAYTLFFRGLRTAAASTAALLALLEPLTGAILAAFILGQRLSATGIAGAAVLVAAVTVTVRGADGARLSSGTRQRLTWSERGRRSRHRPAPGRAALDQESGTPERLFSELPGQLPRFPCRIDDGCAEARSRTVLDKVTIAYRGATYEIGRGRDYFGIWTVGRSRSQPLEWWPETQDGWSAAWVRFTTLEEPAGITPAGRSATHTGAGLPAIEAGRGALVAALLLGVGVVLGIAGLFPEYLGGTSLAAQPDNLTAHVIYLATWTASAVLIALGGSRLRIGALLATGLSIVTFGLFLADAGTPIAGGAHLAGMGLLLSFLGWLVCAAGSAVAFLIRPAGPVSAGAPASAGASASAGVRAGGRLVTLARPRGAALGPAILLVLAGLGAAVAFVPSWDSFTLHSAAGQTQTITLGNAFADPGPVIAGNVIVMVALAAVVIAAALWRPVRHGAILLAGAVIPMAAQAISALIQIGEPTSPTQFGYTPAQASQLGLTVSAGLTPAFWIYCVCIVVLVVSCTWMLFTPHEPAIPVSAEAGPRSGGDAGTQVPTWHVARADAYDTVGVRTAALDDDEWDIDQDTENGEFDSYEEFESDNPADSTVTPESQGQEIGGQD